MQLNVRADRGEGSGYIHSVDVNCNDLRTQNQRVRIVALW